MRFPPWVPVSYLCSLNTRCGERGQPQPAATRDGSPGTRRHDLHRVPAASAWLCPTLPGARPPHPSSSPLLGLLPPLLASPLLTAVPPDGAEPPPRGGRREQSRRRTPPAARGVFPHGSRAAARSETPVRETGPARAPRLGDLAQSAPSPPRKTACEGPHAGTGG